MSAVVVVRDARETKCTGWASTSAAGTSAAGHAAAGLCEVGSSRRRLVNALHSAVVNEHAPAPQGQTRSQAV